MYTRGKPQVDDLRVRSGIVHVLKSGGRWVDAPPDYGPKKTLYNRYVRWAAKGVWSDLYQARDRVEIPDIKPDVTRVMLHAGVCPCCGKRFPPPTR